MIAFDPAALDEYVRGGFRPVAADDPDGPVELSCTPELEAATFAMSQAAGVWERPAVDPHPVLVVGGRPDPNRPPSLLAEQIAEPAAERLATTSTPSSTTSARSSIPAAGRRAGRSFAA